MVGKLLLRTHTLQAMNTRVKQLLEQAEELGENLTFVDFEQAQIENKQFTQKFDQKNRHLLQLKKMAGEGINSLLHTHKLTNSMAYEPRDSMPNSQGLSDNHYPEPYQSNSSY